MSLGTNEELKVEFKVLDNGYLRFVEAWGHGDAGEDLDMQQVDYEVGIVEAARQSTQGNFRGWEEDEKLLKTLYLSDPQHATPFEFSGMTLEMQMPVIVFREWHRHRTQSYNEMSARYAPMPDTHYIPDWQGLVERGERAEKSRNKQEKGTHPWNKEAAKKWLAIELPDLYLSSEYCYKKGLQAGVPKELARLAVTVGRYSRQRASANLRNWLAFVTLRFDPSAQWEIRQYAVCVAEIISKVFPRTWKLYLERGSVAHKLKKVSDKELTEELQRRGYKTEGLHKEIM